MDLITDYSDYDCSAIVVIDISKITLTVIVGY